MQSTWWYLYYATRVLFCLLGIALSNAYLPRCTTIFTSTSLSAPFSSTAKCCTLCLDNYDVLIDFVDVLASPARCRYSTIVALWGHQLPCLLYILVLVLCRFVQHLIASVMFKGGAL